MGLSINTNVAALNAYRNLGTTQGDLSKSLEKLSSGLRINRAADDAAGLAISEGLRAQIGGTKQAVRNAQDGISVVQTAEGALTETHSILQRMRTLSVQAANDGGLSTSAKTNIQDEIGQLKDELTRIADTTQFNGRKLLDGSYDGRFQVGANTGERIDVKIGTAVDASGLGVNGVDVTKLAAGIATAGATAAGAATTGAVGTAGSFELAGDFTKSETFDTLNGTVNYGGKSIDLSTIEFKAGADATERLAALTGAIEAKLGTGITVAAAGTTGLTFTGSAAATAATQAEVDENNAATKISFTQASGADLAIKDIDKAIGSVSKLRSQLGAVQNRFDHTINNLNVAVENLSASESRIRDTDMAQEMVSFTRSQILSQAGTAMLAQAKNLPQSVLSLLQ
ncbi:MULTISPECIES: flagellin N-terminal helical domain-containing protein [Cellulomonas]|jgi:flagellin|uniref:Flagellin n=2 Tax=Cellulomonas TaxID=1707 RepID=A0ABU0GH58_9CELL|nr:MULTISPECIES: flagellin [Cellulomonas]MDQ0424700.1 flagellin [Cellulomonas iranensis]TFH70113.1 flagellin [Cellulomonas sp. HD19AZ1]UCN14172.1 flagellin [Cellulomonas iranensis]